MTGDPRTVPEWTAFYQDCLGWRVEVTAHPRIILDDPRVVMLRTNPIMGACLWREYSTGHALICRAYRGAAEYWLFPAAHDPAHPDSGPVSESTGAAAWVSGGRWELPAPDERTDRLMPRARWWPYPPGPGWTPPARAELAAVAEGVAEEYARETNRVRR